jgi:hypothetical protein
MNKMCGALRQIKDTRLHNNIGQIFELVVSISLYLVSLISYAKISLKTNTFGHTGTVGEPGPSYFFWLPSYVLAPGEWEMRMKQIK